ncbi:hypothetical protein ACFPRL_10775 [Pseudoclavibacter helvolus]
MWSMPAPSHSGPGVNPNANPKAKGSPPRTAESTPTTAMMRAARRCSQGRSRSWDRAMRSPSIMGAMSEIARTGENRREPENSPRRSSCASPNVSACADGIIGPIPKSNPEARNASFAPRKIMRGVVTPNTVHSTQFGARTRRTRRNPASAYTCMMSPMKSRNPCAMPKTKSHRFRRRSRDRACGHGVPRCCSLDRSWCIPYAKRSEKSG